MFQILSFPGSSGGSVNDGEVDVDVVVARCAGLDVHKDTVMACVRTPGPGRQRQQQVREFRTFTGALRALRDWLVSEAVTQVAMEATGVYWKPVWHMLADAAGVEPLLVNAQHVKNVPGRKRLVDRTTGARLRVVPVGVVLARYVASP